MAGVCDEDWGIMNTIHTARRLYKPDNYKLSLNQYAILTQRFIDGFFNNIDDPRIRRLFKDISQYNANLALLGLKDAHLRIPLDSRYN